MEDHWQPIETAPDGVDVLIWSKNEFMTVAMKDGDQFLDINAYPVRNPQKWMPLPEPPKPQ